MAELLNARFIGFSSKKKTKNKKQKIKGVGENMEKLEPLYIGGRIVRWCNCCGKQHGLSSNTKNGTTIPSSNPTSGYIYKRIEIGILKRYLHSHVRFTIIHNSQHMETI